MNEVVPLGFDQLEASVDQPQVEMRIPLSVVLTWNPSFIFDWLGMQGLRRIPCGT